MPRANLNEALVLDALAVQTGLTERTDTVRLTRISIALPVLLVLAFAPPLSHDTAAQERRVPSSTGEVRLSYAPVVQRITPAVVNVYAARIAAARSNNPLFDDPIFRRFFGMPGQAPGEQVQRALGSGVLVDPAGLVVTNNHVIEGADEVRVSLADKREFEA